MGGMFGGFMEEMFRHMDARRKAEKKAEAGITLVDGMEGIPRLNIPHKYHDILISDEGYFSGHINDTMTIYNKEGKFLFECHGVEYLGYGMFLVGRKPESVPNGKQPDKFGYALYNDNKKITDPIFRTTGWQDSKFHKEGFAILTLFEGWSKKVVVNKAGEILVTGSEHSSDYIYLKGIICSSGKKYINLLTGETICEKKYSSDKEMSTDDLLFVEVDKNCIYQINKTNGEFIVHGEIPKKEEPKPPVKYTPEPPKPKIKVPNRNDSCHCGSGKKYKHCCLDKKVEL